MINLIYVEVFQYSLIESRCKTLFWPVPIEKLEACHILPDSTLKHANYIKNQLQISATLVTPLKLKDDMKFVLGG